MVPRAGVEPAHPKIQDFESSASANSAIWAYPRFGKKASCPLNARIRFLGPARQVLHRLLLAF